MALPIAPAARLSCVDVVAMLKAVADERCRLGPQRSEVSFGGLWTGGTQPFIYGADACHTASDNVLKAALHCIESVHDMDGGSSKHVVGTSAVAPHTRIELERRVAQ